MWTKQHRAQPVPSWRSHKQNWMTILERINFLLLWSSDERLCSKRTPLPFHPLAALSRRDVLLSVEPVEPRAILSRFSHSVPQSLSSKNSSWNWPRLFHWKRGYKGNGLGCVEASLSNFVPCFHYMLLLKIGQNTIPTGRQRLRDILKWAWRLSPISSSLENDFLFASLYGPHAQTDTEVNWPRSPAVPLGTMPSLTQRKRPT